MVLGLIGLAVPLLLVGLALVLSIRAVVWLRRSDGGMSTVAEPGTTVTGQKFVA